METLRPYSDTPNQSDLLPIPPWPAKYSQAHLRPSNGDIARFAEGTPGEKHMPQLMRGAAAQGDSLSQFRSKDEQLNQPAKSRYTQSEVRRIQKRRRETRYQDLDTSERSRRLQLEPMQRSSSPSRKDAAQSYCKNYKGVVKRLPSKPYQPPSSSLVKLEICSTQDLQRPQRTFDTISSSTSADEEISTHLSQQHWDRSLLHPQPHSRADKAKSG